MKSSVGRRQKVRMGMILATFFLFPALYTYFSPYLIVQATTEHIINGSFVMFAVMFFSAGLVGRAFCGWICPAGGCQESLFFVRDRKIYIGNFLKWVIWIPWIFIIVYTAITNNGYEKIDVSYQTYFGFAIGDVYNLITYLFVLILIVLPAYIFGRRAFCHHLCWMAPFMILGRKISNNFRWPSLRLKVQPERCIHCHNCTESCPMSLAVEKMVESKRMENPECILCATCADGCASEVIRLTFKRG